MVRDGIIEVHLMHVTIVEGGQWYPVLMTSTFIKDLLSTLRPCIGDDHIRALRRGTLIYDFVLRGHRIYPWRVMDERLLHWSLPKVEMYSSYHSQGLLQEAEKVAFFNHMTGREV